MELDDVELDDEELDDDRHGLCGWAHSHSPAPMPGDEFGIEPRAPS
jgi:hypothetical protein